MIDTIIDAVNRRLTLMFFYDDKVRTVEPHAVGHTSKGKLVLRGYQPDGETQRGLGWKLFSVEKIEDLAVTEFTFENAEGYKLDDKQIPGMLAQVDE